jgi:hypothetical protein
LVAGCWSSRHHTDIPRVVKGHTDNNSTTRPTRTTNSTHTCTYTFSHIYKHPAHHTTTYDNQHTQTHRRPLSSHHTDEANRHCLSESLLSTSPLPSLCPFLLHLLRPFILLRAPHPIDPTPSPSSLLHMSLSQVKRAIQQREHPKKDRSSQ